MSTNFKDKAEQWLDVYLAVEHYMRTEFDLEYGEGFCTDHQQWFDVMVLAATQDIYRGI